MNVTFKKHRWSLACLLLLASAGASAADCAAPKKTDAMDPRVFDGVQASAELLTAKKYDEAIAKLSKLSDEGGDFDKAVVALNLGLAYSEKSDYPKAADAFAKAVSYKALPQQQQEQVMFNLGQLYVASKQYEQGATALRAYMAEACGVVPPEAHLYLANALTEAKKYKEALPEIELAISSSKVPKESWVQLKLAVQYEMKDFAGCGETLVRLIDLAPAKADYWKQLSGVLFQIDDQKKAAAVLALAERQGIANQPAEIKNLYSMYMTIEAPLKAGMLMERAIEKNQVPGDEPNLESVANAWLNARETVKAETYYKKLAAMSDRSQYYFLLGGMYGDAERWKESKEMLQKAIEKGDLKRPGEVYMRLAVANYGLNDVPATQAALRKASGYPETRAQASEWLRSIGDAAPAAAPAAEAAPAAAAAAPGST